MKMPLRVLSICAALSLGVGCFATAKPSGDKTSARSGAESDKLYLSGIRCANRGDYKHALTDFTSALLLVPGSAEILIERGDAYLRLHRLSDSRRDCEQAILKAPNWADGYSYYSRILDRMGDTSKSAEMQGKAFSLNPKSVFVLGEGYFSNLLQGKYEDALSCDQKLIESHPWRQALGLR